MKKHRLVFVQDYYAKEAVLNIISDILKKAKIKHRVSGSDIEMDVN